MRRRLILTVAAAVSMVLLAMLVPMAVLLRGYALEDRLSRAALEVQATETVVSGAGDDAGAVAAYLEEVNAAEEGIRTSVVFPDGLVVGPPVSDVDLRRVVTARATGTARVDDVTGGSVILVPVSLGPSSAGADQTPVVRIFVAPPGWDGALVRSWVILVVLGLVLFGGALLLADRLGRTFVTPIERLADDAAQLGDRRGSGLSGVDPSAPPEVRELGRSLQRLVERVETLLERERTSIADLSHRLRTPMTALRLRAEALRDPAERARLAADLDELQATVDHVVREARRSEREGLVPATDAVTVLAGRAAFWEPLAEDQGRPFTVASEGDAVLVSLSQPDLEALLDVLLDNVFTHTPDGAAVRVAVAPDPAGVALVVEDAGPGLPPGHVVGRGASGAGSTGIGLAMVATTAAATGGDLTWGRSELGGARVVVVLGRT